MLSDTPEGRMGAPPVSVQLPSTSQLGRVLPLFSVHTADVEPLVPRMSAEPPCPDIQAGRVAIGTKLLGVTGISSGVGMMVNPGIFVLLLTD